MKGKNAFVTGSTGGIGTAICRHLAKGGALVVAGYNNQGNLENARRCQEELRAEGFAEDEIFEQTVAAAVSEGLLRLDAALRALG